MNPVVVLSDDEVVALVAARGWRTSGLLFSVPPGAEAAVGAARRGERSLGARAATDDRLRPALGEVERRLAADHVVVLFVEGPAGAVAEGLHVVHYVAGDEVLAEWTTGAGLHRFDLLEARTARSYTESVVRAVTGDDDHPGGAVLHDGHRLRLAVRSGAGAVQSWSLEAGSLQEHAEPSGPGTSAGIESVLRALGAAYGC